jgi:hypothetical protein
MHCNRMKIPQKPGKTQHVTPGEDDWLSLK